MLRKGEVFAAAPPHIAYCPPHACHLTHPAHLPPAHAAAHRTPHTSPDSWPPPAAHRTGHNRRPACSASAPCLFPRCRAHRFPVARRTLRSLAHRNRRPRFTLPATLRPLWRPTAPPCCSAPFRRVLPRPPCCRCTSPTLSANAPACFLAAVRAASLSPACRTPGAHPGEPPPRFPVDLGSYRRTPYPGSCPPHAHPPHSRRPQNRPPGRTAARCLLLTPGARCPPLPLPCFKQRPAPTQKPSPPGWQRA